MVNLGQDVKVILGRYSNIKQIVYLGQLVKGVPALVPGS
jgi:hypothetical protein